MNTSALVVMIGTLVIVTGLTIYFFTLVLRAPQRAEPDSFSENDDEHFDTVR